MENLSLHFCLWDVPAGLLFIFFLIYSLRKIKAQKVEEMTLLKRIEELQATDSF